MRTWHNRVSIALGLPLLLVGLTTFFIAHEKSLGTKEIRIPMGAAGKDGIEVRSLVRIGNEEWVGTPQGVFRLDGHRATLIVGSPKDEIRDMAVAGKAVLLAGKTALWRYEDGKASVVQRTDCWRISADGAGFTAVCKDHGLLTSQDGKTWQVRAIEFPADLKEAQQAGTPLSKIIMDIHTGKLFFGKQYEWIWIDLLGIACVGLGITGLVMWMRGRRQRARVPS
jgi:hypothetical protein